MLVINARNINEAWDAGKGLLNANHITRPSRVGEVFECEEPVSTVYQKPCERVLINEARNSNHFFTFMESLWMLAGRNDVAFLERFNSKIKDFVGRGPQLHDAYGDRWRKAFDLDGGAEDDYSDQLLKIIKMLKKDPNERRAVLTMWNPIWDLDRTDCPSVPCNLVATFKIRNGKLAMIVFCRSNDIVFGAYGANVVHFSILQEYMASMIGVEVGTYTQISDSFHAYTARWKQMGGHDTTPSVDIYKTGKAHSYPLVSDPATFDSELLLWMDREWEQGEETVCLWDFKNKFFSEVAEVLWQSWDACRNNNLTLARTILESCKAEDWKLGCQQWFRILELKRNAAKNQGATA
jgi:thymidylate synthase